VPDLPSRKDLVSGIRRRARRLWYGAEDLAIAAGRIPRWIGDRARHAWFALSLEARRGAAIAAGAVVAAAAIILLLVPALPCQFPGGDRCAPPDDAVALVPGDALLYLHANTDPDSEQYEQAAALAKRLPTLVQQALATLPGAAGTGIDYREDVRPWLGGEAAVTLVPGDRDAVEQALLLEVDDDAGSERFVDELVGRDARSEDYREVPVTARGDLATAVVGGFLALGSEDAVRGVIDTDAGNARSLDDAEPPDEVADELPDDSLVQVYVSERGAEDLFRAGAPLGSLEAFVNSDATRGAGAALVVTEEGFEIESHSLLDSERLRSSPGFFEAFAPFEPSLADELSSGALAYLGLGNPEQSIKALLAQATADAPGLVAGFDDFTKQLADQGEVNLQREVLPLLAGEAALGIEPPQQRDGAQGGGGEDEAEVEPELPEGIEPGGPPPLPAEPGELSFTGVPYVGFVADEVDEEQARKALADLQVPISKALDPDESGQAAVFEGAEIEGLQARSLRISPIVNLTYAIFDEKLVVATDPVGVEQVKGGDTSLVDSDAYERATEGFPDELAAILYLNVGDLIALAEQEGLGADPAYALFAGEIRKLEALGLAVTSDETAVGARMRLTVED
jgi:Protein of unknown function (DUF3352)